jgi:Na+/H+ antiporter NhaA
MAILRLRDFLKNEAAGGILLMIAALLALIVANSDLQSVYQSALASKFTIGFEQFQLSKALILWINDLLMAFFFLLVGLEVKREIVEGQLSSLSQAQLPIVAAIGGMAVPAAIYVALNQGDPEALRGWAIPAATDIAFALGVLALLKSRAPIFLKVLLTAIAIIDDLGAIVIIAVFYTADLNINALGGAAIVLSVLALLNILGHRGIGLYLFLGLILWVLVLKSGVHATLAGVATAMAIPLPARRANRTA